LTMRKSGAALSILLPCDDWHRSLDRKRRTQSRYWRLDCARRYVASQWKKFD
jgi:hypothetical protein